MGISLVDLSHIFLGLIILHFLSGSPNTQGVTRFSTLSVRIKHSFWLLVKAGCYPVLSFWVILSLSWFPHTKVLISTLLSTQERLLHIPREPSLAVLSPPLLCSANSICLLEVLLSKFKSHTLLTMQYSFLNSVLPLTKAYIFWSVKEENYLGD